MIDYKSAGLTEEDLKDAEASDVGNSGMSMPPDVPALQVSRQERQEH